MSESFVKKQQSLLTELKKLALTHNRDYYFSIIPFVEAANPEQEDVINSYADMLENDKNTLRQSRNALVTPGKVSSLLHHES